MLPSSGKPFRLLLGYERRGVWCYQLPVRTSDIYLPTCRRLDQHNRREDTAPGVAVVTVWIESCCVLAISSIMMIITVSTRVRVALLPPAAGLVQAQVLNLLPARVKVVETIEAVSRGVAA